MGLNLAATINGAVQSVGTGLNYAQQMQQLQEGNRKQAAGAKIAAGFRDAAGKGGLSNMDSTWFTDMAANIAETGDYEGATKFSDLGATFAARRSQMAAQRASVRLASGDFAGAATDLNDTLMGLGISKGVTGVTQGADGTPAFQTAEGHVIPVARAQELLMRATTLPAEQIKAMTEQMKAQSEIAENQAQTANYKAGTETENLLRGDKLAALKADTSASYARGDASRADASRTRQGMQIDAALAPVKQQQAELERDSAAQGLRQATALEGPTVAEAITKAQRSALDLGTAQQTQEAAVRTAGAGADSAEAKAVQDRTDATVSEATIGSAIAGKRAVAQQAINTAKSDPRGGQLTDLWKAAVSSRAKRDEDAAAGLSAGGSVSNVTSAYSPALQEVTLAQAQRYLTENADRGYQPQAALDQAASDVQNLSARLQAANPELLGDPNALAEATALLYRYDGLEALTDPETGKQYLELDIFGNGPEKLFLPDAGS